MSAPRDAASLILWRGGTVLMGMRGAAHAFMPNRLVFPGGAVDAGDADAPVAAEAPGPTLRALERAASPGLARALTVAAARELEEETGLSLGAPPDLSGLDYLCRAVTPPDRPVRFDARFLICDGARASGVLAGSGELEDLRWWSVADALALDLAWITGEVLRRFVAWRAMEPGERAGRTVFAVCLEQGWGEE